MHVMTLDGGFRGLRAARTRMRGLRALTTVQAQDASQPFIDRTDVLYQTKVELERFIESGTLAHAADLIPQLRQQFDALDVAINDHIAAIDTVQDAGGLTTWNQRSATLLASVAQWVSAIRSLIGSEETRKPVRIALLSVAAVAVFGGVAFFGYRAFNKRKR